MTVPVEQDWTRRLAEEHLLIAPLAPPRSPSQDVGLGFKVLAALVLLWAVWSVWPSGPIWLAAAVLLAWAVGRVTRWLVER